MNADLISWLAQSRATDGPALPPSLAPEMREVRLPQWAQIKLASLRIALLQAVSALEAQHER